MTYPHRIKIVESPVPPKTVCVLIETDYGRYTTTRELFADHEEFLEFWKPLVEYYEEIKHASNIQ